MVFLSILVIELQKMEMSILSKTNKQKKKTEITKLPQTCQTLYCVLYTCYLKLVFSEIAYPHFTRKLVEG